MSPGEPAIWSSEIGDTPAGYMHIAGDVVLVPAHEATTSPRRSVLHALSLSDGSLRWRRDFEDTLVSGLAVLATPEVAIVAALSAADLLRGEGALVALDAAGETRWRRPPGGRSLSAPAVAGNLVCFTVDSTSLVLLDADSGDEHAHIRLNTDASLAAPLVAEGVAFVPCRSPHLLAVGLEGKVRWQYTFAGDAGAWLNKTPAMIGDRLFAATAILGQVIALGARDGSLLWRAKVDLADRRLSELSTDGHRLYLGSRDGVRALDPEDGHTLWRFTTGRRVAATPAVAGGVVYAACHDHSLYAIDAVTGKELWRHEMPNRIEAPPLVTPNGLHVIAADNGGALAKIARPPDAEELEAAGQWAQAAELWQSSGHVERAIRAYRQAELWVQAAQLCEARAQWAEAVECYERAKSWAEVGRIYRDQLRNPEIAVKSFMLAARAAADRGAETDAVDLWLRARDCYQRLDDTKGAENCLRDIARLRKQPHLQVRVQAPQVLTLEEYHEIVVELVNDGGGTARQVLLRHTESEFAGDLKATRQIRTLPVGEDVREVLLLRALAPGQHVPLDLFVTFADDRGEHYEIRHREFVTVKRPTPSGIPGREPVPSDTLRTLDVEVRILNRQADAYPVTIELGDGREASGSLDASVDDWIFGGDPLEDGRRLFDTLFADGELREMWGVAKGSERRRIRLRIDPPELNGLPWELLRDGNVLLSASAHTPFSRYLPVEQKWGRVTETRRLRVLAVIANPTDLDRYSLSPVDVESETSLLQEALSAIQPAAVRLDFLDAPVTLDRLQARLRGGYDALHIVCHGAFSKVSRQAALFLQNAARSVQLATDEDVAQVLTHLDAPPRLVFLAACQSATRDSVDAFRGLGPRLIRTGVPAVIAMQDRVSVTTARQFGATFYARLLEHGRVDVAANEARATLLVNDRPDVGVPVLFMRLKDGRLWQKAVTDTPGT